jgi:hypothetical protein
VPAGGSGGRGGWEGGGRGGGCARARRVCRAGPAAGPVARGATRGCRCCCRPRAHCTAQPHTTSAAPAPAAAGPCLPALAMPWPGGAPPTR